MIYCVTGEVIHLEQGMAVIECGGVGYACRATMNTVSRLRAGDKATLFTYMSVREDAVELFGFLEQAELNCFKMLITISGVGPKAAVAILSELSPQAFALAVVNNDSKALTRAQGIGNKIAQRIVLELKDKLEKDSSPFSGVEIMDVDTTAPSLKSNAMAEATSALVVLGFSAAQAEKALSGLSPELSTQELVKEGLKKLSGR